MVVTTYYCRIALQPLLLALCLTVVSLDAASRAVAGDFCLSCCLSSYCYRCHWLLLPMSLAAAADAARSQLLLYYCCFTNLAAAFPYARRNIKSEKLSGYLSI
ncbi:hypothetical protein RND81_07G137300 [Saponaria officinalis]|uniref:Secreted protein n=1 Tax=Saponaria officinalis TaxID=3572 RepID=A0AAW1JTS8_SAPOF